MYGIQSPYDVTDREFTTSIFRQATAPIAESMSVQLGHTTEYAAIFLPAVFDMDRVRAASKALFPALDGSEVYAIQHAQSRRIALESFDFLEGSHVGPVPTERIDGDLVVESEPLILVLEYEKDYLHVGIHSVDWEQNMLFMDWDPSLWPSCGEYAHENIGEQAYAERVITYLHEFIDNDKDGRKREDVRAIALFGEASILGFRELGAIVLKVVGTNNLKLVTDLAPSDVVPHGAALWTRRVQEAPKRAL